MDIVFFIVYKVYFSFGFMEALDSKLTLNTLKRYYVSRGMH